MKVRGVHPIAFAVMSLGMGVIAPRFAQAEGSWSHHASSSHHGYHSSSTVVVLPSHTLHLRFGDGTYYYYRGYYYRECPSGYMGVPAPMGAVVPILPPTHRTIVIDGVLYHEYGGVYYKGGPAGYTIVPIAQTAQTSPAPVAQPAVVINVPNKNGSYTPVTLQLTGNGMYIGPQGEVYPTLPNMAQLQAMYGK